MMIKYILSAYKKILILYSLKLGNKWYQIIEIKVTWVGVYILFVIPSSGNSYLFYHKSFFLTPIHIMEKILWVATFTESVQTNQYLNITITGSKTS